jgi:hypothetical protein
MGRDVKARLALKDEFFDPILWPFQHTHETGIQRALLGRATNSGQDAFPHNLLSGQDSLRRCQRSNLLPTRLQASSSQTVNVIREHLAESSEFFQTGKKVQFIGCTCQRLREGEREAEK